MISKRDEIRQLIKEAMRNNDLESLNNRFREETKLQIIKKMNDDKNRKKKENQQGEDKLNLKGKVTKLKKILFFFFFFFFY